MAWQNAPALNKLTASRQGGNRGAQLWGVDYKGTVYTTYQTTPGGEWSAWSGPDWGGPGYPKQVYELAAAQQGNGGVQIWVLDGKRQIWTNRQPQPGGGWEGWRGPGWNSMPGSLKFTKLTATRLAGGQGAQFWGITDNGILTSCWQILPAGNWSPWQDFKATPEGSRWIEVTAAQQGDGKGALWGLDSKRQLWGTGQASVGGAWGVWNGPNWLGAPKLRNIAAAEGPNGAIIWGQDEDYRMVANFQVKPGTNEWSGWSTGDWHDAPLSYEPTAAGQNNGCVQLWAIGLTGVLHSIAQTPPGCAWGTWQPPRS